MLGLEDVSWEEAEGSGFVWFGEKEAEGQPYPPCSFLRRGHGEGSADLTGMLISKQGQGRFRPDIRKCFFIEHIIKYCTRLPGEVVDAPDCQCLRVIWAMVSL